MQCHTSHGNAASHSVIQSFSHSAIRSNSVSHWATHIDTSSHQVTRSNIANCRPFGVRNSSIHSNAAKHSGIHVVVVPAILPFIVTHLVHSLVNKQSIVILLTIQLSIMRMSAIKLPTVSLQSIPSLPLALLVIQQSHWQFCYTPPIIIIHVHGCDPSARFFEQNYCSVGI